MEATSAERIFRANAGRRLSSFAALEVVRADRRLDQVEKSAQGLVLDDPLDLVERLGKPPAAVLAHGAALRVGGLRVEPRFEELDE
jgi:hypothetical protein